MNKKVSILALSVLALGSVVKTAEVSARRANRRVAAKTVISATNNSTGIVGTNSQLTNAAAAVPANSTTPTPNPITGAICGKGTFLREDSATCEICNPEKLPDHASWIADPAKPNQCAWECDKFDGYKKNDEDGGRSCVNAEEVRNVFLRYSNAVSEATAACSGISDRTGAVLGWAITADVLSAASAGAATWAEIEAWKSRESTRVHKDMSKRTFSPEELKNFAAEYALKHFEEEYASETDKILLKKKSEETYTSGDKYTVEDVKSGASFVVGKINGDDIQLEENEHTVGFSSTSSLDADSEASDGAITITDNQTVISGGLITYKASGDSYIIENNDATLEGYQKGAKKAMWGFIGSGAGSAISGLVTVIEAAGSLKDIKEKMSKCNDRVRDLKTALNEVASVSGMEVQKLSSTYNRGKAIIENCGDFNLRTIDDVRGLLTASSVTSAVGAAGSTVAAIGAGKMSKTTNTKDEIGHERMALIGGAVSAATNTSSTVTTGIAWGKFVTENNKAEKCDDAI